MVCSLPLSTNIFILQCSVRERHVARIGTIAATSHEKEKIGYVPRGKGNFAASGLTSAGMMGTSRAPDQILDEESQMNMARLRSEDEEIDQGVDMIGNTVDTLSRIAGDMNSEVGDTRNLFFQTYAMIF
jgi:hypothetical protein